MTESLTPDLGNSRTKDLVCRRHNVKPSDVSYMPKCIVGMFSLFPRKLILSKEKSPSIQVLSKSLMSKKLSELLYLQ